jgi:hypothetical protein
MNAQAPRFCASCRHADLDPDSSAIYLRCGISLDQTATMYLVTGEARYARAYCSMARTTDFACGPEGKLWQEKPHA